MIPTCFTVDKSVKKSIEEALKKKKQISGTHEMTTSDKKMTLSTREHQVTRLVLTTAPLAPLLMVKMSEARVKVFTGHETRRQGDSISSSSTTNIRTYFSFV